MTTSRPATWRNWERSLESQAEVATANSIRELRAVLGNAARAGKSVRVAAGGRGDAYSGSFSGSPVVVNDGGIIVMTPGRRVGWVEDSTGQLTAQGGMRLREVDALARRHRLVLPTSTAPDTLTVAGAVALGCHGCGRGGGTLSDAIVGMKILAYDGSIIRIDETSDREHLLAARVCLGSLGIILEVTFQLQPAYKLVATDDTRRDLRSTIDGIEALVDGHDYTELFWYPGLDTLWTKTWDRVPLDTPDLGLPGLRRDRFQQWATSTGGGALLVAATHFPKLTPLVSRMLSAATPSRTLIGPAPRVYHYQTYFPRRLFDLSYAIETGPCFATFKDSFLGLVERTERYLARGNPPFNFVVHCRFFETSTGLLAPAVGFHGTCMFEVLTYVGSGEASFFDSTERHWLSLGGRPHWGKNYNTDLDFRWLFGHWLERFERVRRCFDPRGRFLNHFLRHVFDV